MIKMVKKKLMKFIETTMNKGKMAGKVESFEGSKNNMSIKELLENPSIIEERLISPTKAAIENLQDDKSFVYNTFFSNFTI